MAFLDEFDEALDALADRRPAFAGIVQPPDDARLAGRSVRVRQGDRIIEGIGRGIDAEGALRLETERGIETILGGQVLRDS